MLLLHNIATLAATTSLRHDIAARYIHTLPRRHYATGNITHIAAVIFHATGWLINATLHTTAERHTLEVRHYAYELLSFTRAAIIT